MKYLAIGRLVKLPDGNWAEKHHVIVHYAAQGETQNKQVTITPQTDRMLCAFKQLFSTYVISELFSVCFSV